MTIQAGRGGPVGGPLFMLSYANLEEKGSDVNVAAHHLLDVLGSKVDGDLVDSNDSDLGSPSSRHVRPAPVQRVCFAAEGPFDSDGLYIFTDLRPGSWAIPVEAEGGADLLNELVRRGLFDAGLAITAALASSGLFCWPPADTRGNQ